MKSEVKLSNVTKSFRKERVLKGITHSFEQGKIHGIMGFNGSGKTVMFKCICGFLRPDSGAVIVQGRRIGKDGGLSTVFGHDHRKPGIPAPYQRICQSEAAGGDPEPGDR